MTVLSSCTVKKGRKAHYCEECNTLISKGDPSHVVNQVFEGEFSSFRAHLECHAAGKDLHDLLEADDGRYFLMDGLMNWGGSIELKEALETLKENHPVVFRRIDGEKHLSDVIKFLEKRPLNLVGSPGSASPKTENGHGGGS